MNEEGSFHVFAEMQTSNFAPAVPMPSAKPGSWIAARALIAGGSPQAAAAWLSAADNPLTMQAVLALAIDYRDRIRTRARRKRSHGSTNIPIIRVTAGRPRRICRSAWRAFSAWIRRLLRRRTKRKMRTANPRRHHHRCLRKVRTLPSRPSIGLRRRLRIPPGTAKRCCCF